MSKNYIKLLTLFIVSLILSIIVDLDYILYIAAPGLYESDIAEVIYNAVYNVCYYLDYLVFFIMAVIAGKKNKNFRYAFLYMLINFVFEVSYELVAYDLVEGIAKNTFEVYFHLVNIICIFIAYQKCFKGYNAGLNNEESRKKNLNRFNVSVIALVVYGIMSIVYAFAQIDILEVILESSYLLFDILVVALVAEYIKEFKKEASIEA